MFNTGKIIIYTSETNLEHVAESVKKFNGEHIVIFYKNGSCNDIKNSLTKSLGKKITLEFLVLPVKFADSVEIIKQKIHEESMKGNKNIVDITATSGVQSFSCVYAAYLENKHVWNAFFFDDMNRLIYFPVKDLI